MAMAVIWRRRWLTSRKMRVRRAPLKPLARPALVQQERTDQAVMAEHHAIFGTTLTDEEALRVQLVANLNAVGGCGLAISILQMWHGLNAVVFGCNLLRAY